MNGNICNHNDSVVMLYNGAINFINQAKEAIAQRDYEKKFDLLSKAIAIITGLNSCLGIGKSTDKESVIEEFYKLVDMHLVYIKYDNRPESCDKVIADLEVMRDNWIKSGRQIQAEIKKDRQEITYKSNLNIENIRNKEVIGFTYSQNLEQSEVCF